MRDLAASDWADVKVADVTERHFCGPSPDCEERPVFDDAEWGVLKTTAITWSGWNQGAHKVLPRSYWGRDGIEVKAGDVLVTKAGPRHRVAVVTHVPATRRQLVVSGKMIGLRPRRDLVLPEVLAGLLALDGPQKYIHDRTTGMAESQVNFANDVLLTTPLRLPPKAEQAEIARISAALDTTIRQTGAIIEKLKQVKQGLLHDLLTRGIDASGELRPPQGQAPHLYKDSPLGWIPREWNVCGVLDLAPTDRQCILTGPFGAQLGQADFVAEGVPVLRIGNVQAGFIDWSDVQFVSHAKAGRLERFSVEPGDLLFARQGATTGRNALADQRAASALINYHIIRVAVDRERCEPVYLHALFNSDQSKGQVDQEKGRGTREGINSKQIAALRFAMPQIKEQRELVARMGALANVMVRESNFAAKLRLEKSGLMDNLLTGRVRVTPLLDATASA